MREIKMHLYDYKTRPLQCLTPEIAAMIADIHEHKGRQELFIEANKDEQAGPDKSSH